MVSIPQSVQVSENNKRMIVSVAFATDANYIAATMVAVKSLILHASENYDYCIYILSEQLLKTGLQRRFVSAVNCPSNISITFISTGDRIDKLKLSQHGPAKKVTQATYLRFLLADLLQETQKVLYIDVDTVILDDVAKIFLIDIDGCYVGGVRDISQCFDTESRCRELGIPSLNQYVNAGVLMLDLDQLRRGEHLSEKMLALAAERCFPYNDQDIINIVCYGRIYQLPLRCNVIVDYLENTDKIPSAMGMNYLQETSNPIILHYAGRAKPWYHPKNRYSVLWWNVASSFKGIHKLVFRWHMSRLLKKP